MCVFYKFGATGAVPAGAFFQQKYAFYFFETQNLDFCVLKISNMLFLCLQDIKTCSELPPACPQGLFSPKNRPYIFCTHNLAISVSPIHKIAFRVHETLLWDTPADPADPADWCHELPLRPSLHTRRGSG